MRTNGNGSEDHAAPSAAPNGERPFDDRTAASLEVLGKGLACSTAASTRPKVLRA